MKVGMKQQSKDIKSVTIRSNGDYPTIAIEHFHVTICASLGELFGGVFFVGIGLVGDYGSIAVLDDLCEESSTSVWEYSLEGLEGSY